MVWNLTNPEEFIAGGKPNLEQVGPFSYTEKRSKFGFKYEANDEILYYKERKLYYYYDTPCWPGASISDLCSLPENTKITQINVPLVGIVQQLQAIAPNNPAIPRALLNLLSSLTQEDKETLVAERTAYEIVWGYDDGLLNVVNELVKFAATLGINLDLKIPDRYALLQNNSADATTKFSAVHTGKNDMKKVTKFVQWQGNLGSLNIWNGCDRLSNILANMINGTEGFQFSPKPGITDRLYAFTDDLVGHLLHYVHLFY